MSNKKLFTIGDLPSQGNKAPDFVLTNPIFENFSLSNLKRKTVVLYTFPSIAFSTCLQSIKNLNALIGDYKDVVLVCVSLDLPNTTKQACSNLTLDNTIIGSSFRSHIYDHDFGLDFGVEIMDEPLRGLLARSIVVINKFGFVIGSFFQENQSAEVEYEKVKLILNRI